MGHPPRVTWDHLKSGLREAGRLLAGRRSAWSGSFDLGGCRLGACLVVSKFRLGPGGGVCFDHDSPLPTGVLNRVVSLSWRVPGGPTFRTNVATELPSHFEPYVLRQQAGKPTRKHTLHIAIRRVLGDRLRDGKVQPLEAFMDKDGWIPIMVVADRVVDSRVAEAAYHAARERVLDVGGDATSQALVAFLRKVVEAAKVPDYEVDDIVNGLFARLFLGGDAGGNYLGPVRRGDFRAYVKRLAGEMARQAMAKATVSLDDTEATERATKAARSLAANLPGAAEPPASIKGAAEALRVSRCMVRNHLQKLGLDGYSPEAWPRVKESILKWFADGESRRAARERLEEAGSNFEAARKRVSRAEKQGTPLAQLGVDPVADGWAALSSALIDDGATPAAADRLVDRYRRSGTSLDEIGRRVAEGGLEALWVGNEDICGRP
jgi:hypothetical protein